MKKLILLALLLGIAVPGYATTYYVNKAGNNGNSCATAQSATDANAKLTVNSGLSCLSAGDTLIIGDGTYAERIHESQIPSGSMGAPTIIQAESNRQAIIAPNDGLNYVIQVDAALSWVTFDGLVVDGNDVISYNYYLAASSGTVSHIRIINGISRNSRYDGTGGGVGVNCGKHDNISGHHDIEVSNMEIYGSENDPMDGSGGYGLYIACHDSLFENNTLHDNEGYAVVVYTTGEVGVDNNVIRNNRIDASGQQSQTAAVLLSSGDGNTFYNNLVFGNPVTDSSGVLVAYNGMNTEVLHNTIYANNGYCAWVRNTGNQPAGSIFRNNICYGNGSDSIEDDGTSTTTSNNLFTDPHFVNAAIGDFHLLADSDALGAGVDVGITTDLDGVTRPDPPAIGALEVPSGIDPLDPLCEDFESYSAATSIHGLNGCQGWTQSWNLLTGTATVETAPAGMTGKALRLTDTAEVDIKRLFTAHSGEFTISTTIRSSITNPNSFGIGYSLLDTAGQFQTAAYFLSGNLVIGTQTFVSGISADTNYAIDLNFDTAVHPGQYRARVNGGAYGAWQDCQTTCASIAGIEINSYSTNAHTFWLDDISDESGPGGSGTIDVAHWTKDGVIGDTLLIGWASNGITGNVDIYYLIGTNAYLIATVDVAATPYTWTINAPAATDLVIRVSQGAVTDDSDPLTILGTKIKFRN